MAENESLNLDNPYGRRWAILADLIRRGEPFDKVARRVRRALYKGLRISLKQFVEYGITLEMLLQGRHSPQLLRQFVRQIEGHDYIRLFADIANASPELGTQGLLDAFVVGIWETVEDKIAHRVVGSNGLTSFTDVRGYLDQVAEQVKPDVDNIARRLSENPSWKPKMPSGAKDQQADTTVEMLSMSLLGSQAL